MRDEGETKEARKLDMFIKHYEAARDIARVGILKQQWSKIHAAFQILQDEDDIHYDIPTSTYCLITRKHCDELLLAYKFMAFAVAWFPLEMSEDVAASIGASEAILGHGDNIELWSSHSPGFAKCKPGPDADEEEAGDENPLLTWMTQVVKAFFSNVLFEHIQAVDTVESLNVVLSFCRTVGPPMVQCKFEEDWQLEILLPITNVIQMMSAVLDPVPRTLGSSAECVWYCCTEPSDGKKRRRKTDLGESAVAEEAKVFISEFRSNSTWTALLTDFAEAAPAEEQHGQSFLEHASEMRAAKNALFEVEVEHWKDVLADKVKPALTTYEKRASAWREHFRIGAMDDLDKDVSELLAKMHSLIEQTGGTQSAETDGQLARIQELANTCGAGDLAQKIHMDQVHPKEASAKKQLLDMAAIDLNTFESITDLKKCIRNLQNQTKDQEVRIFMMDLYNKVPPAVCNFVIGSITNSNAEHLIKEACGLAKAICRANESRKPTD